MSTVELEETDSREAEQVARHRYDRFTELGFKPDWAHLLADDLLVDWHRVEEMLAHGCPHAVAVKILV